MLQLGGSDPKKLAEASRIGESFGYDEININIGCPSDRVQSGRFGACLMAEPDLVAECFTAMQAAVEVPVSVKCRLGIDDQDLTETLPKFLAAVEQAGCQRVIIHARKAWLQGLSPKENRTVPPLDYRLVRQMKSEFPNLLIELNGGLTDLDEALADAEGLDGIMLGRSAYHDPWILSQVDQKIYGDDTPIPEREDVLMELVEYVRRSEADGYSPRALTRHVMGLFAGQPGARLWRRRLSEAVASGLITSDAIEAAYADMQAFRNAA